MLKIIHAADFHLDSPFSGLMPAGAVQRRREQRQLLERLAALVQARGADLVLLAGDLLDGDRVYRETVQALTAALGAMPCPVFLAPGNHDFYSGDSAYAAVDWPDNVHLFTGGEMEAVPLPELNCTVYGRAFLVPHEEGSPLSGFRAEGDGLRLGVLHGEVGTDGGYAPMTEEEIAASGLHYLALGHIHQCSGLKRAGDTFWAYPGCPEGRGFDETGDKGVLYGELEPGACRVEFVPLIPPGRVPGDPDGGTGGGEPGPARPGGGAGRPVLRPDPAGPHPGEPRPVGPGGGRRPCGPVPAGDEGPAGPGAGQ